MITLPIDHIILWLTILPLLALAGIWFFYILRYRSRKPQAPRSIFYCASCGAVYIDDRDVPMAPCPRCGQGNERLRR